MKTRILIVLFALVLFGCTKKPTEANKEVTLKTTENKTQEKKESISSEDVKTCDDFLNTYESWANDLITLMAKHKDDPVTLATSPEYINTMMESTNFMKQWGTIAMSCSTDDSYSKRMRIIQQKLEERQKELGLK